ncbi:type IV secretion system protein VirB10 [Achromobacter kerstersii]|uniref:Type IV secretion system protein virB10 n=1 Tax=Achromobacter kerstersii TaxID=1353890 RepID=A0A6S7ARG2_9BURK|nr:type IV secretion system protein VirB10 [Achromobacter kerstersii]CAB3744837.1 hypothetical protein LMG3441_06239 [Achromobacter kerstersii]
MKFFKRRRLPGKTVDAVSEIEEHRAQMEGRGRPDLQGSARPRAPGARAFFVLVSLMALMVIGTVLWRALVVGASKEEETPSGLKPKIENNLPELRLRSESIPPPSPAASPTPAPTPLPPDGIPQLDKSFRLGEIVEQVVADPVTQRRLTSGLREAEDGGGEGQTNEKSSPPKREPDSGPMSDKLRPMKLTSTRADMLGNLDMLITQGVMIDCIQDTKLISAQAGMITCYAPQGIRSASGRVQLIDPGTKFVGYQQGVLAQGQPRIGVVWSRLETPKGVVIHLDSPGTGPLGEAGLDGHIDTHFAERFGGAILVSLISDFGSWASSRGGNNSGGSVSFNSTSDAAQDAVSTVLDNSINIPPTLFRNQGGRVGIYVARDLDFGSVYTLRPVR